MMNQNYGMMNGMGMMGGVQYNTQQAKMTQPLTKEEIAKLKNNGNAKLVVDELDLLRAKCTHKQNGQLALIQNNNGTHTCNVCGATFNLIDTDPNEVEALTQRFIDVLQSIKTYYLDMPVNYAEQFFVMIPLLQNTPELYRLALGQFAKYENGSMVNQNNNLYGFNLFNNITSPMNTGMMPGMMNPNMGMMPGMMNPNMGMMNNSMNPNMGMMNPNMGIMNNGMNPFTGQPVGQQPMQQPVNNTQPVQNEQQANNSNQEMVTTTKTFNV